MGGGGMGGRAPEAAASCLPELTLASGKAVFLLTTHPLLPRQVIGDSRYTLTFYRHKIGAYGDCYPVQEWKGLEATSA